MNFDRISEAVSLGLTIPTLVLAIIVVKHWYPRVQASRRGGPMTEIQWLMLGVVIGFVGTFLDNLYWAIPWTLHYLESDFSDWWFHHGSYGNIAFRQTAGILAAICHLKSLYAGERGMRSLSFTIFVAHIVGLLFVITLSLIK